MQAYFLRRPRKIPRKELGQLADTLKDAGASESLDTGIYKPQQVALSRECRACVQASARNSRLHVERDKIVFQEVIRRPVSITKVQPYSAQYDWTF